MCPKIVNKKEKQDQILEAAMQTFIAKGFHNARIDHIAETAGIAKGTVYLYFKSKEEVLGAVLRAGFAQMETKLDALRKLQGSSIERIVSTIRSHIGDVRDFADTHPLVVEVLGSKELSRKLGLAKLFEDWDRRITEIISSMIIEGQKKGEIRKDVAPEDFVYFLQAAGDGIQYQYFMSRYPMKRVEKQIAELERNVRRLLTREPSS